MLDTIVDIIILCGAVAAAITGILTLLGKPAKFFKKRRDAHNEETADALMNKISEELQPKFDNLQAQLDDIKSDLALQKKSTTDMMRWMIMNIYLANKCTQTLTTEERVAVDDLYEEYRASGGNGRIQLVYEKMMTWEIKD